jgi:hypothetical protein
VASCERDGENSTRRNQIAGESSSGAATEETDNHTCVNGKNKNELAPSA